MKTRKLILALVVLMGLVFMQGQAGAFFRSGNNLVEVMHEYEKSIVDDPSTHQAKAGIYAGYIMGVHDGLDGLLLQTPSSVTVGQVCAIVAKYLKNHPERWNESASILVIDALREAFPLPKKK